MRFRFQSGGKVYDIHLERRQDVYVASIDGLDHELEVIDSQPGVLSLRFSGRPMTLYWADDSGEKWISLDGCIYKLDKPAARIFHNPGEQESGQLIRAPMPAKVRTIQIREGETVDKGRTLLLLEAMKMEIRIKAPSPGHVTHLLVSDGQSVEKDQILAEIGV